MTTNATQRLRRANPVPRPPERLDARAQADLATITASWSRPPGEPARARRPRALAVLAAVVVTGALTAAGVVALDGPGGGRPAFAATPAPLVQLGPAPSAGVDSSAPAALAAIAARVERLPDDRGVGPYARLDAESWALWTSVDGRRVTSEVVPARTTSWLAADGSGRQVSTVRGQSRDERLTPGIGRQDLSAVPAELAAQLEVGHPVANGPAERLVAIGDLAREQPLSPRLRAAVLRYLAETPGLAVLGMVQDRAGRPGLAVAVESSLGGLPNRRTLVVSPDTGAVLAEEETLTQTAGALNVPIPSVISYTTFLDARWVSSTE